jgi:hypothetical protein
MRDLIAIFIHEDILDAPVAALLLIYLNHQVVDEFLKYLGAGLLRWDAVILDHLVYSQCVSLFPKGYDLLQELFLPRNALKLVLQLDIKGIQVHLLSFHYFSNVFFNGLHEIGSELPHQLRLDQFLVYLLEVDLDGLILHL